LHCPKTPTKEHADALDDELRFTLGEIRDAAVDHDVGVRAVHQKEVRKVRHGDAEVGPGVTVPLLTQIASAESLDLHRREEVGSLEAGAVDDDVDIVLSSIAPRD